MSLEIASIFSGCGGLDYGWAKQGAKFLFANDFNKHACSSYRANFRKILNVDVDHLREGDLNKEWKHIPEEIDLLIGGFPCQSWSLMGKRRGFDDERGQLFFTTLKIIQEKQPKFFILENVAGLLSHDEGRSLQMILEKLRSSGYDVIYRLLDFSEYDVPQRRRRVIFWGKRRDQRTRLEALIPKKSFNYPINLGPLLKSIDGYPESLIQNDITKDKYRVWADLLLPGENLSSLSDDELQKRYLLKHNESPLDNFIKSRPKGRRPVYKLDPLKVAPTMVFNGGTNIPWHPWNGREITVREAAIIQTFPLGFEFHGKPKDQYHQIANAVSPRFSEHLAECFIRNYQNY